jgi:hypothetical protein
MKAKKNNLVQEPEFGIDSRYANDMVQHDEAISLMSARLEKMKYLPKEEKIKAKLMQLKLKMENFLDTQEPNNDNHFSQFLEDYIDILYRKRSDFAQDINENPNFISKVINNHREPKEEFIQKLIIHSDKTFKQVGQFHENLWFKIYYHQKLTEKLAKQSTWRAKMEKQVSISGIHTK